MHKKKWNKFEMNYVYMYLWVDRIKNISYLFINSIVEVNSIEWQTK